MFFDSHCHIDFDEFTEDRADVLARASNSGVNSLVIPGVFPDQWLKVDEIVEYCRERGVSAYRAVGLHPWWIDGNYLSADDLAQQLRNSLTPSTVAIGECGLDKLRDTPLPLQQEVLSVHLELAASAKLPVILHCVKAHDVMLAMLAEANLCRGGVVHGFGGSYEVAKRYCDLGFSIGVGAMATRPHATKAHTAFSRLPLECLVLETDAPSMPIWQDSQDWSIQRNEPANVAVVAKSLAMLRQQNFDIVSNQCRLNAQKLFGVN